MTPAAKKPGESPRAAATNRRAFHEYQVFDRVEAGIELRGPEVKSIREGRFSINETYARIENGEAVLYGLHVLPYAHARAAEHVADRPKRMLLHRKEIDKLMGRTTVEGFTLVPLKVYFRNGKVKVELGLCKGKQAHDKRDALRKKTADREAQRAIASRTRR
jgi:SsrA-binding protein